MATVSIDLADKTTLDAVATELGRSTDLASNTPSSLFAGMKYLLANGSSVVRRIQRGTSTMNSSNGVTINFSTTLTNPDKCLVLLDGGFVPKETYNANLLYLDSLTAGSMLVKGYSNTSYTFSWQVIEFY
ncbi:MAG: hypothetical protein MJ157_00495 [Clostridia bacterium]|nr:hypothetical protein [Clostridia bacterium]